MNICDFIVSHISNLGVNCFFGVGGANIEDIYDALYKNKINAILCKSEASAAQAADAYSRVTRSLGVVIATSGGGMFNLVPSIAESYDSHIPVLAIIGQAPRILHGKGAFQDTSGLATTIKAQKLFSTITKLCVEPNNVEELPNILDNLIKTALKPPMGPVVLLIAKDLQTARAGLVKNVQYKGIEPLKKTISNEDKKTVDTFLSTANLNKTTLIIGDECHYHNLDQHILDFLDKTGINNVVLTAGSKSLFSNNDFRYSGIIGSMGHDSSHKVVQASDSIIALGFSLRMIERDGIEESLKTKQVLYINDAIPYYKHYGLFNTKSYSIFGLKNFFMIAKSFSYIKVQNQKKLRNNISYNNTIFLQDNVSYSFTLKDVVLTISSYLKDNSNIVVDAGNIGACAVHYLKCPKNSYFYIPLGMGTMGHSFGAAIGMTLANKKITYLLSGDGAFLMLGLEIHTAVELELPIVFLIFNNNAHGMCYTREKLYFSGKYTFNKFKKSNYSDGIKKMFPSIQSYTVKTLSQLKSILEIINITKRFPIFVSIELEESTLEELPPLLNFKKALKKIKNSN